ncbi:MAG: hypothetical protein BHW58_00095 [Azospirillum sp. 51_20]|nr:MAG: hypothetical protein BHW58_00095 [Azospirillum sp. 51_20]
MPFLILSQPERGKNTSLKPQTVFTFYDCRYLLYCRNFPYRFNSSFVFPKNLKKRYDQFSVCTKTSTSKTL